MGYEAAVNKAWEELLAFNPPKLFSVKFLADEYSFDTVARKAISMSCNVPAKDHALILMLHYQIARLKSLQVIENEWLDFKELSAVEGYGPAFRKRVIEPIIRKYGKTPEGLIQAGAKFKAKKAEQGDIGIIINIFDGVPALVVFWKADEEFGAEANVLFDKSITRIFCIEDIIVMAEMAARQL
ncbi:MAG: DUF3786 domain-containing protein [Candidatus Omnitrophota bacterium]